MEKRALLALALSIVVIFLYQFFLVEPSNRKKRGVVPERKEVSVQHERDKEEKVNLSSLAPSSSFETEALQSERNEYIIETSYARIVLDTLGGQVKAIQLNKFFNKDGRPVDMMGPHHQERSFSLYLKSANDELDRVVNTSLYGASSYNLMLSPQNPQGTITFIYQSPYGLRVIKSYEFKYQSYSFSVSISLEGFPSGKPIGVYQLLWQSYPSSSSSNEVDPQYEDSILLLNKKIVKETGKHYGNVSWVGLNSKYFLMAFLPHQTFSTAVAEKNGKQLVVGLEFLKNSPSFSQTIRIYAGPKENAALKQVDASLEKAIDYGWVSFMAGPLLWFLHYLYQLTGNYGMAIILLTILIKIVFFPLSHKSFKSMQAMKDLQPSIKDLQEKYKGDKQKLSQEMFSLYREKKVNPFGGCLPMVLQIPVFFALYRVLLDAIEIRNAPFFGWIADLSSKDPYYIYPILMGASMVIQQRMTPQAGDPMQQKMMMFMPVIFTVMFLNFPVGLVIYWLVNNVLTIGQQYITMKWVAATPATGGAPKKRILP